jgi:two-component system CheB/CheR fusion protein
MRARQGVYTAKEVDGVPPELLKRYFEHTDGRYVFRADARRSVIFGRHDLIQDAPISRIDLLSCRNTLMYFNSETQGRIIDRFYFALNPGGLLFLGKSETLLTYSSAFVTVDLKRRLFAKVTRGSLLRDRYPVANRAGNDSDTTPPTGQARVLEAAFEAGVTAELVVDFSGLLILANERARGLFNLTAGDLGCPFQDLQVSYRPADLRSCIDRAYAERRPIVLNEVEWLGNGAGPKYLEIHVVPLLDPGGTPTGVSFSFVDVTSNRRLQAELQNSNRELATAYEELQSTNEELETTNEELQSTNEELETTNEELQSSNEELETMNEELQSTNEEIETINEEIRERSEALKRLNTFLESILSSLPEGVAVVDRELLVQIWNGRAEDLWGLRSDEVQGRHLLNLDIGLPLEGFKQPIRDCLGGAEGPQALTLSATNRRGRKISCRTSLTPMKSDGEISGVILVMTEEPDGARPSSPTRPDA